VAETDVPPALLVACCGNSSAGDDGLGTLVARALVAQGLPADVELLDLGSNPAALISHIESRAAVIVVDAIASDGRAAGELIDCAWPEARDAFVCATSHLASTHGLGLADQLVLADKLGILPRVVRLLGLTIERASVGCSPSDAVRNQLPGFVRHVRAVADEVASALSSRPAIPFK
jgi:hydrogenase maturation protease